jgi:hypothetical protein
MRRISRRDENDIGAKAHGGQVSITAEVKREHRKQQGPREIFTERSSGQVYRSFTLPDEMKARRLRRPTRTACSPWSCRRSITAAP